ncbi:MAG: plastocyanin/azurin family copper-binding protein [bacterium]
MKINKLATFVPLVLIFILSFISNSFATIRDITAQSFFFSPSNISASVGDTIRWTWLNGSHTTTCDGSALTSRPAGAAPWNAPLNSLNPSFRYVITIAGTYNYRCNPHGAAGMVGVINASAPPLMLNLTSIIEGLWNGSSMVSDTVKVYLRNSINPFSKADSTKVKLNSSGNGILSFSLTGNGSYYIVVTHRNSIETWSKLPQTFSAGATINYNFTTSADKAFGNNLTLKAGKYTIYSGDVNQDGTVDLSDLSLIDNDAFNFIAGYVVADVNGDETVDIADAAIADNNAFNFVIVMKP